MIICSFLNMPPQDIAIAIASWFSTLLHTRLIRHALKTPSGPGLSFDTYLRLEASFFLLGNMTMFKRLELTTYSSWIVSERASDDYLVYKTQSLPLRAGGSCSA